MDRNRWASPEKLRQVVFGLDTLCRTLSVFASKEQAAASVQGLSIAEGDYRFFASDGSALEARFSVPAQAGGNIFSHGKYGLEPNADLPNIWSFLLVVECDDEAQSGLSTLRDIEQFLIDMSLNDV